MHPERRRATLYLVLIFLCGTLSGAVGVNLWQRVGVSAQTPEAAPSSQVPPSSRVRRAVERFTQKLQLTPEQAEKLAQILEATRGAYQQHELEIESIRRQGNARIRELLTDEQKPKFDELLARAEEKRNKEKRR